MFFVDFLAFYGKMEKWKNGKVENTALLLSAERQHGVTVRYPINLIPESGMSNCSTPTKFKKKLTPKNNFSARDGRIFAFQWAETTFPMGGSKNFANRKKIKRPSPPSGRPKTLAGIKTFSYLCCGFKKLRAAAAKEAMNDK